MKRVVFLSVFLCIAAVAARAEVPKVAVMDFTTTEFSSELAAKTSEFLRLGLINNSDFVVIMKSQAARTLRASGIDMNTCFTIECASRAGRALGASRVLTGNLIRTGKKIVITCVIVDVAGGFSEYSERVTSAGEDDLADAAARLAGKISDRLSRTLRREVEGRARGIVDPKVYRRGVALAVTTSMVPFWSGSFNRRGFDGGGLAFVMLKSASLGCIGYFYGHMKPAAKNRVRVSRDSVVLLALPAAGNPLGVVVAYVNYSAYNPDKDWIGSGFLPSHGLPLMYTGIIGLPVFIVADMIYSGVRASRFYKKMASNFSSDGGSVSLSIEPKISERELVFSARGEAALARWSEFEGANLAFSMRF